MLDFCDVCKNLMYISVIDKKLIKQCKYCNTKKENDKPDKKIIETNYITNNILYQKYYADFIDGIPVNKLLANDPTLPRIIDNKVIPPENYKHDPNTPVSYIKQIDGTYLWISSTTGEIWH